MVRERVLLRSSLGVPQEWEFILSDAADGYCVRSILRIEGCHPRRGPGVLTPVPYTIARRWMESRTAKLSRHAARFTVLTLKDELAIFLAGERPLDHVQAIFELGLSRRPVSAACSTEATSSISLLRELRIIGGMGV